MHALRAVRTTAFVLMALVAFVFLQGRCEAQGALLLEQPYGLFGTLNPTGHTAVYFARICAASPTKLRRCEPGELGSVISRYSDVAHHDWVIIPLVPYLYSVENPSEVPSHVDREIVNRLRDQYHEAHLLSLGRSVRKGDFWHGGWTELVGVAYERQLFAFRFETTEAQDNAFIARMNKAKNRSHFELFYNNCADFSRVVLNQYFPHKFRRSFFPDAGMSTPKQITHKLTRYAAKHPETHLEIYEIPQIPGYRHPSRRNKGISESLVTTAYALPIAVLNPYVAGGLFLNYVAHGRYELIPKDPQKLTPEDLDTLTVSVEVANSPPNANEEVHRVSAGSVTMDIPAAAASSDLKETLASHE